MNTAAIDNTDKTSTQTDQPKFLGLQTSKNTYWLGYSCSVKLYTKSKIKETPKKPITDDKNISVQSFTEQVSPVNFPQVEKTASLTHLDNQMGRLNLKENSNLLENSENEYNSMSLGRARANTELAGCIITYQHKQSLNSQKKLERSTSEMALSSSSSNPNALNHIPENTDKILIEPDITVVATQNIITLLIVDSITAKCNNLFRHLSVKDFNRKKNDNQANRLLVNKLYRENDLSLNAKCKHNPNFVIYLINYPSELKILKSLSSVNVETVSPVTPAGKPESVSMISCFAPYLSRPNHLQIHDSTGDYIDPHDFSPVPSQQNSQEQFVMIDSVQKPLLEAPSEYSTVISRKPTRLNTHEPTSVWQTIRPQQNYQEDDPGLLTPSNEISVPLSEIRGMAQ